jgi:hypothetical protein
MNATPRYCGRTASHPTAPAQIPACSITAPGSSGILASATWPFAIPCKKVDIVSPALLVRPMLPVQATYPCQPLPLVTGPTVSEYYGLI